VFVGVYVCNIHVKIQTHTHTHTQAAKALADKQVKIAEDASTRLREAIAARAAAEARAEEEAKEASSSDAKSDVAYKDKEVLLLLSSLNLLLLL